MTAEFAKKNVPIGLVQHIPKSVVLSKQVKVYMGDGWRMDFSKTHFDAFSPPDFYTRVRHEDVHLG